MRCGPARAEAGRSSILVLYLDFDQTGRRAVHWGKDTDFLIYMYFPGRWNVTDDSHAKLRPKWIKLAQILDPYASNGAFVIAWIVR